MIRLLFTLALILFGPLQTQTQYDISYRLAMSRPVSHLFEVTIDVTVPPNETSSLRCSTRTARHLEPSR